LTVEAPTGAKRQQVNFLENMEFQYQTVQCGEISY